MHARTAIVTGTSRGIGVYIARALAERGYDLLLVARSQPDLVRVANELRAGTAGGTIAFAAVDLSHPDAPRRIADAAARELGDVGVLVNNAAVELQRRVFIPPPGQKGPLPPGDPLAPRRPTPPPPPAVAHPGLRPPPNPS